MFLINPIQHIFFSFSVQTDKGKKEKKSISELQTAHSVTVVTETAAYVNIKVLL